MDRRRRRRKVALIDLTATPQVKMFFFFFTENPFKQRRCQAHDECFSFNYNEVSKDCWLINEDGLSEALEDRDGQ